MKSIGIYGRAFNDESTPYIQELFDTLSSHCKQILLYGPFLKFLESRIKINAEIKEFTSNEDIDGSIDYLFSIGGDGTLLDTLTLVQRSGIPILGINTGRLGFLASIAQDEISNAIEHVINGSFTIDKRTLISLDTNENIFGDTNYAMNEFTIQKRDTSSMITINTYLDGKFLNAYWADGLIIATPTGSTGYSLSCGGPIVFSHSGNLVITPIASHNLNNRPIIVSDQNVIEIEIDGRDSNFLATLDSRSKSINSDCKLTIRKADFELNLIRLKNYNFLDTLRSKLMWGVDTRN